MSTAAPKIIKYFGRTTDFRGKPLWEILGHLKNFGVGRIVTRSAFERYPEPCYYRILQVEALPNSEDPLEARKVKVMVEKVHRGIKNPVPVQILGTSYKADYRLIPKHEEAEYCREVAQRAEKIFPRFIDVPPLLREYLKDETGQENPQMPLVLNKWGRHKTYRLAEEGEQPNVHVSMGLGTPVNPKLYPAKERAIE
ncbi:28S ribosomal protein S34, mitochondrial [Lutzomyia longipalpis]|uniref:28S ribosomal protein S34, mitochondrial n=1 Tax=Lutzomyia longipalpis TaxID=7200 RepID=UPI002483F199|nr:28S ribosomal protein S34, mitochondrial [Lutzomyia longipalpis]